MRNSHIEIAYLEEQIEKLKEELREKDEYIMELMEQLNMD